MTLGELSDVAVVLAFACEHLENELLQCCLGRLNDAAALSASQLELDACADILITLCTHNLNEQAKKVIPVVAKLSTGRLKELQGKVPDAVLLETSLIKAEQLETQKEKYDCSSFLGSFANVIGGIFLKKFKKLPEASEIIRKSR